MNSLAQRARPEGRARSACIAVTLGLSLALGACADLLDVELPAQLTDEVLNDPVGAAVQINTIINNYETQMSDFMWTIHGHEDGGEIYLMSPQAGVGTHAYGGSAGWVNGFAIARVFANNLHDKLETAWTVQQVPQRSQYLAISSIYEGAVYAWMGATLCEGAVDGGPLMTQAALHDEAERLLTRAITEIGTTDFAVPYGVSTSALSMAYGLRAQHRWARGDKAGARADAERIPRGFRAFVTREATTTRRNLPFYAGTSSRFAELKGVNDWWQGATKPANPATSQPWPSVIPFTGYQELGILADGRAVREDGLPIRRAGPHRDAAVEDAAVPDTRVRFNQGLIQGKPTPSYINAKFASEADDIPLVNWKEMWLIRAEAEGGQRAIDLVNEIRVADALPSVTYANPGNATQIKYMIIEERRRTLFLEGRYYYTKLQNLDLAWFPRRNGTLPGSGANYQGGVRFAMPDNEYILNTNLGGNLDLQGSGCSAATKPTF